MKINVVEINQYAPVESVFSETAKSLTAALQHHGFASEHLLNQIKPNQINIVLGANYITEPVIKANKRDIILFNFEQLESNSALVTPYYKNWLRTYTVMDYHSANVKHMIGIGADPDFYKEVPIPAHFEKNFTPVEKTHDICFVGAMNARREKILTKLKHNGFKLHCPVGVYGQNLVPTLLQSKLVLNIHYYETKLFPPLRALRPAALNIPFVSEDSVYSEKCNWSQSGIEFAVYDEIPALCDQVLSSPTLQQSIVNKNSQFIEQIDFVTNFISVLNMHCARHRLH